MTEPGLSIALLGAECTGKTALAHGLADTLRHHGWPVGCVDEWLRSWCQTQGRTPQAAEQRAIAETQQQRIEASRRAWPVTVCDTTPLMTAVYSVHYFGDTGLLPWALRLQAEHTLTLLLSPDLPWEADGLQRDGEAVRAAVDHQLRGHLRAHGLRWVDIAGHGDDRLQAAWSAVKLVLPTASATTPTTQFTAPEPGG
ncbi:MAG: ATP-binding protein [Rubrivivax sp.]|nr:ATP-binding protein [Rubrivivax sp.]